MTVDDTESLERGASTPPLRAVLYPSYVRLAAGMLSVLAGASLLAVLALLLLSDRPVHPLRLMRLIAGLCVLPGTAVLVIHRQLGATLFVEAGVLVLAQRWRRVELPLGSIARIEPWWLPLPGSGLGIRLRSGARWPDGIETPDPGAVIDTLAEAGHAPRLRTAARHPGVVFARARRDGQWSWRRALLKFPVFALVPTLPLFRVHQIIAYGGTLGEYYQYGLAAYAAGFAITWATLTIYVVLYAAALRVPVELVTIGAVLLAPAHAARVRQLLDRLAATLYYAGVPVAVGLRFVPW